LKPFCVPKSAAPYWGHAETAQPTASAVLFLWKYLFSLSAGVPPSMRVLTVIAK
jgi:hypothetical protein